MEEDVPVKRVMWVAIMVAVLALTLAVSIGACDPTAIPC